MSISNAKELRKNQTKVEQKLWFKLRNRQLQNLKFRRQVGMGRYVADFLCHEAQLIIEIDGGQHAEQNKNDAIRTKWFGSQGYRVIRFWNNEVMENLEGVLETIIKEANVPLT